MHMHLFRYVLLFLVLCAPIISFAAKDKPTPKPPAEESILAFSSSITVNPNASLRVQEKIKIHSTGETFKYGICRDIPLVYRNSKDEPRLASFQILGVKRDGKAEKHHTQEIKNGIRIYMGKKDVLLPPGDYTFTLVFKINHQIKYYEDFDELYWNVTGNAWAFTINRAMASVTLPPKANRENINIEAYTGSKGETGKNFRASVDNHGVALFTTTKPLKKGEGLTVRISFPKECLSNIADTEKE